MKNVNICNSWFSLFNDGQKGWFILYRPFKWIIWKKKKIKIFKPLK